MIVLLTLLSLVLGLAYGFFGIENGLISTIAQNTNIVLYVLMFSVGISIGMHEGILQKIKEYHIKIFIVPLGIIAGSLVGGLLCSAIANIPVNYSMAIASGMGWYSLAGATISKLVGAEMGSIAFMSNLMREVFSFGIIPFLAVYFNYYTCIAPAGATSEDTTLPVMLKYTNEETVVLSVLNGMICSFFVPILISIFLNL
ncbi:hypothetical protein BACCAP_03513 [Pseudoflavonifractor capillosus ATCC 29799]|uniref:Lysine exporter LysO family protein n=1 Tax=Pseudoflavonifractor capillosus ATCC 29799 TaxID=411467 RepID=A6NZ62_9FIRM|nr:hypothetical protein BACCAP_03513 [Pseudoflavonifractor capillosus ATCC 29799]